MQKHHHIYQGSIYWLQLPYSGSYEDRKRPYLVISNNSSNRGADDIIVVPLTNHPVRMDLPCNVYLGELIRKGEPTIARCSILKTVSRDMLTPDNFEMAASQDVIHAVQQGIAAQMDMSYLSCCGGCDGDVGLLKQKIAALAKELDETKGMLRAALSDFKKLCEDSGDGCGFCENLPCAEVHGKCIGWKWRRHHENKTEPGLEPWENEEDSLSAYKKEEVSDYEKTEKPTECSIADSNS